jgi:hypothetical protein
MREAPIRLLDDPTLSAGARAPIHHGASTSPVDYDVDAGLTRFRTQAAVLTVAAALTHASTARAFFGGLSLKVALAVAGPIVGAGIAVGIAVTRLSAPDSAQTTATPASTHPTTKPAATPAPPATGLTTPDVEPRVTSTARETSEQARTRAESSRHRVSSRSPSRPSAASSRSTPAAAEPPPVHLEETDDTAARADRVEPAPDRQKEAGPPSSSAVPTDAPAKAEKPVSVAATSSATGEMRAIASAKALLAKNPAQAVAALDAIRRDFPAGFFVEERRALTVLALARSGNHAAANTQGAAFLKRYPNGPYAEQVRAAMSQ